MALEVFVNIEGRMIAGQKEYIIEPRAAIAHLITSLLLSVFARPFVAAGCDCVCENNGTSGPAAFWPPLIVTAAGHLQWGIQRHRFHVFACEPRFLPRADQDIGAFYYAAADISLSSRALHTIIHFNIATIRFGILRIVILLRSTYHNHALFEVQGDWYNSQHATFLSLHNYNRFITITFYFLA